ncbi:DUF5610 domain-containing protein [Aliiglaciecola sp. M165]|uniref:DUF5610 domain-containing protein n=1 Tax=Aliiglaciecola sp. M165 TaxID=2593649 RepID=UPI00117C352D|nr:DUF5610 domain-containing protein [Aliiglaciecola sp. M165]TRY31506.1 hypothetical protein FM019_11585 [Aliiglaciecola sp. M165]
MNFGEIKAFLGEKPQANPNDAVKQQLRESGLRQASEGLNLRAEQTVSKFSSQTNVGVRVYSNAFNQTLQIDGKKPDFSAPKSESKSLFDFEEIAKNVLRFVGGVITSAARGGADEDALNSLFEQARSGVAKGIKLAEKDLAGFLNEEINEGISKSADLIERGIQRLQDQLFNKQEPETDSSASSTRVSENITLAKQESGELNIRTRDGDEVTIRFEDFQQFEFNRQILVEQSNNNQQKPPQAPADDAQKDIEQNDVLPRQAPDQGPEAPSTLTFPDAILVPSNDNASASQGEEVAQENDVQNASQQSGEQASPVEQNQVQTAQQAVFIEQNSFSFSVNGELDEAELASIGQLVSDANDLANTFFSGDIETAFNQALELGFDEQELSGFALQLTRQEQVEVVKTYESVSLYDEQNDSANVSAKPVERVSEYLEKMLNVLEQSQQKLADSDQYEQLITGLVNQIRDLGTTDLVTAINDFHAFNKRLLDNLPNQNQDE